MKRPARYNNSEIGRKADNNDWRYLIMKKILVLALALIMALSAFSALAEITVGIVNNPPSESGYREANVKNFEEVFSADNG